MATKSERISNVLCAPRRGTPEVIGASAVSSAGLFVVSALKRTLAELVKLS
jgi:hypothetical protein